MTAGEVVATIVETMSGADRSSYAEARASAQVTLAEARKRAAVAERDAARAGELGGVLSEREEVVARKVAQGKSNRAIADELDVTEGTMKVFLSKIFAKLGISNRTELAIMVKGL